MSDDRKIELTLDEIVLRPVGLRARAAACASSRRAASRLLNLVADKVDALPKPRMAEPTEFGAKVRTRSVPGAGKGETAAVRADPGSNKPWFVVADSSWHAWRDLLDPEPLP